MPGDAVAEGGPAQQDDVSGCSGECSGHFVELFLHGVGFAFDGFGLSFEVVHLFF